jgi:MSHA biogenesis protein MshK
MDRVVSPTLTSTLPRAARRLNLGGALALALLAAPLAAQTLSDPTQPPAALLAPARPGDAPAPAPAPAAAGLQSVLISRNPGGRKVAVINGQVVRVGERFGGATVIGIGPNSVTLRRGKAVETMKLFPSTPAGMK